MAQINKSSDYFNTKLYTGNGSTQSISSVGFQPDMTWIKNRGEIVAHVLFDSVRGAGGNKELTPNETYAEGGNSTISYGFLSSFDSDGFSVSNGTSSPNQADYVNKSSINYTSWNWLASNTTASNTDGSITSTVSANTTSGFSIVNYTGNGSSSATVGHGLGVIPSMVIVKGRSDVSAWYVKHKNLSSNNNIYLNSTGTQFDVPTGTGGGGLANLSSSTTFGFLQGTTSVNNVNTSSSTYIAYCFAEKKGFSKFGSYTGNGSADGTFIYTGFKPAFVLAKQSSASGQDWTIYDDKRNEYNVVNKVLYPNGSSSEATAPNTYDFLSNGFKLRTTDSRENASGATYIYMAFAESPLVGTNNTPATAR